MMAPHQLAPCLLLFAACAHCGSSTSEPNGDAAAGNPLDGTTGGEGDAATGDAASSDAGASDARSEDSASGSDAESPASAPLPAHTYVYVGGYSDNDPFRMYEVDRGTLALREIQQDADVGPQPSWICASADGNMLYIANESDGQPGITVMRIDRASGIPSKVDHAPAFDKSYVFTSLDPTGKFLLAASYNGGNAAVYPVQSDGTLGDRVDQVTFGAAQSHSIRVAPSGKWAFVPNKQLDSVAQFAFGSDGKLTPNTPATFTRSTPLFDGPRHIAFSPDGALAFVILEVGDELTSFAVESNGRLRELDREPRLPADFSGQDSGAHVLSHPNGRFVYGSNRGSNTIAVFAYDAAGQLTLLEHEPTRGRIPRGFDIDPSGEFMVVANQEASEGNGGSVTVFAIEPDGRLTPKANPLTGLGSPVAVAIVGI